MSDSSSSSSSSDESSSSVVEDEPVEEAGADAEHESENEAASEVAGDNEEESKQSGGADASVEKASGNEEDQEDDDDDVISRKHKSKPPVEAADLFGDLSDDDDAESDDAEHVEHEADEQEGEGLEEGAEGEAEAEAEEGVEEQGTIERLIQVEMPSVRFDLGKDLYYVRLPNFLSIDPRPFDPETYLGEGGDEEVLDEEGRTRLKMSVENTIRWQYAKEPAEDGTEQMKRRSNARIVKWSDGSMSLHLGSEIFDIHMMPEQQDYNHMYVKQGNGLVGQAVFRKKLTFRPHSTDSFTHRKMTLSMADKSTRVQQVKEMPLGRLKNPELNKDKLIKQEEDALKATVRRETQQRRVRDRFSVKSLEGEDEEGAISLSSIKRRVMTGTSKPRPSRDDDFIDDDDLSSSGGEEKANEKEEEEEEEEVGTSSLTASAKSKKRRLVVNDD